MTKNQEIQRLTRFAATLPEGSYLDEMFKQIVPQFEHDTRSDMFVEFDVVGFNDEMEREVKRRDDLRLEVASLSKAKEQLQLDIRVLKSRLDDSKREAANTIETLKRII